MPHRRILSLWFPRLAAERVLRMDRGLPAGPFAILRDVNNMQVIFALNPEAEARGLTRGQPLRDAQALCPQLRTRISNPQAEALFLTTLRRWAGKFSPWVSEEAPAGLVIDLTGCAHLFGGEAALVQQVQDDCADLGLTVQAGIADTVGAAWALARFAGRAAGTARSGDDIAQEARATRSRAAKRRHWERGGPAPQLGAPDNRQHHIAAPGQTRQAIAQLPIAALRIGEADIAALARLGLRQVGDLIGMPRAALARRFGRDVVRRLDQALGVEPEPVSPARPPHHFATRLTLPDPVGLEDDILAGLDRLLPPLCARLTEKGRGARRVRLQLFRSDSTMQALDVGLARPSANPDRIRPLLMMKLGDVDAGFGIDVMRLEAYVTEPQHARQHAGHMEAAADAQRRLNQGNAMADLLGRIGARIGLEKITRVHPADSHIPEKGFQVLAAAWSQPAENWPTPLLPRPLLLNRPEPVNAPATPQLPDSFRWRRQTFRLAGGRGPERIAPEWWLDDPEWRSGTRDYWCVETDSGARLWLFYAHGGSMSPGWFCHGQFA